MNRRAVARTLAAAALFGASAPAASRLAGDMASLVLAGLLYLGAALAVAPAVARRPPTLADLRAGWRPLAVAVVAGGAVGPALLVAGLARVDAATASILLNLELVATVALAATVFREHLGGRVIVGAGLVAAGGAVLVWEPGAEWSTGALLIAAACVAWGVDNGVTAQLDELSPETVVAAKGLVAGGANLALGMVFAGDAGTGLGVGPVIAALLIGATGYGLSITLWVKGARDLGASRGQVIFATAPFIGALISWSALSTPVTAAQVAAALLAAIGVGLSLRSDHDHVHDHMAQVHEHEHTHPDEHHAHDHGPAFVGRHSHRHAHEPFRHRHPHVPDLHHHHTHDRS
ncbi:DMT family transporter [Actinomarinicola tropica]|uniref:DMT family transporter n=1 Tax=Actinomarinicola tropica TaxID=2789776 RepID=UPI001898524A|nr:DMT family transporter [Actinomarinicola tropica]